MAAVFLFAGIGQTRAAVINATSGSFAAVSSAVASASPGDTIFIPAGTNIWTGKLNISGVTLQGFSSSSTVIVDESPPTGTGSPLIQINTTDNALTRLTQLQIVRGVTNTSPFQNYTGDIMVYGASPLFRIDHCQFTWLTGRPIHVGGGENGLIDHCTFLMSNFSNCIEVDGAGTGDVSWASPSTFGTSNALYMEDNYIYSANNFCAVDIDFGGRGVMRHNTLLGSFFNTHGTETSLRYRSSRQFEIYNNTFNYGGGQQYNNFYTACDIRGGTGIVFSNTFVGFWSVANLNCYRATDNDQNFAPWFGATGLRAWDSNGPALLTGNASADSATSLIVTGAGWTSNQWLNCTVYNYNNSLCGVVTGNSADTMTFKTSRTPALQITFKQGDQFTVHRVYPLLDQPGMGQGDLLTGDSPTPVWLHETSEPLYFWGNSLSLMYQVPTAVSSKVGSNYPNIQENRDYFNDTPKPGYTPFIYPHPWTLMTNAVAGTNIVITLPTNTPPPVNTLAPPTGLTAHPL